VTHLDNLSSNDAKPHLNFWTGLYKALVLRGFGLGDRVPYNLIMPGTLGWYINEPLIKQLHACKLVQRNINA